MTTSAPLPRASELAAVRTAHDGFSPGPSGLISACNRVAPVRPTGFSLLCTGSRQIRGFLQRIRAVRDHDAQNVLMAEQFLHLVAEFSNIRFGVMCGLGILENSMTSMGAARTAPQPRDGSHQNPRRSPRAPMPCAGSSFMAMVPPVVSTITFLLSMSLFLEGEKGRDTSEEGGRPFLEKGPSSSSKPPPSFPKDFWPVRGGTPDAGTGIRQYATRRLSAKIDPARNMLLFHQNNRVSFFKKRVEEPKHVRKPFHTFPRYFSLPAHPTKQSHPAGPSPYGKVPTCPPSLSPTFISPTPPQPQTSQALIRAWRNGRS